MLYWLAGVAIAAIGVTLVLKSALPAAAFALLAVPLLLLAGLAAALAELVQAFRHHRGDARTIAASAIGTVGLGLIGLPLTAALAFATIRVADWTTILRNFPIYRQVVAEVQRGAITPSGAWQERDSVRFVAEVHPGERVVFRLTDTGFSQTGIVYDPTGGVVTAGTVDSPMENPRHRIGNATLQNCHPTLITAYYRCDVWELDAD